MPNLSLDGCFVHKISETEFPSHFWLALLCGSYSNSCYINVLSVSKNSVSDKGDNRTVAAMYAVSSFKNVY
jgi:hypothetical protein